MQKHPILGWPIVTSEGCFQIVRDSGIKPWKKIGEPVIYDQFIKTASATEINDFNRFAPKTYAVFHTNPLNDSTFNAFKVDFKPYSLVIAFIDDKYIAVTAEWKHGNDKITIVPVCGVSCKTEENIQNLSEKMKAAAIREWKEETGLELDDVMPLSSENGIYSSVRNSDTRCFPYLGYVKPYTERGVTKFDSAEHLVMLLFPIDEWIKFLEDDSLFDKNKDFGLEDCSRSATYAALRRVGKLKLVL